MSHQYKTFIRSALALLQIGLVTAVVACDDGGGAAGSSGGVVSLDGGGQGEQDAQTVQRPRGWKDASHGKDTVPAYDLLFSTKQVHTIEITIAAEDHAAMQEDLAEILGESGGALPLGDVSGAGAAAEGAPAPDGGALPVGAPPAGGFPGGAVPEEFAAACDGLGEGDACEFSLMGFSAEGTCQPGDGPLTCIPTEIPGGGAGGPPGGGGLDFLSRDPIYVPVEVRRDGEVWSHVGMRYKGNSSLVGSYQAGNGKLAFRLDFDQFEDTFPEIEDQRFYGFKKLTFSSAWNDDSLIRDAYVSEVLRDRGIPAAYCAFYRVIVDVGDGPVYWGLYTMIEDPADGAMLDKQLGGRGGNLYKPEGTGADWSSFDPEGFEKKTNKKEADWSDVDAAIEALHASTSDAAAWRSAFEATFDVDLFLSWLAVNTAIVNWDSYGSMAHNYYLYAAEESAVLRWIPWDHNLAMMDQGGFGLSGADPAGAAADEIFHAAASSNWPLISRLLQDPVYLDSYREKLRHALGGLFDVDAGPSRMRELHDLISPFVVGPDGEQPGFSHLSSEQAFLDSIDGQNGLAAHVQKRHDRVQAALDE